MKHEFPRQMSDQEGHQGNIPYIRGGVRSEGQAQERDLTSNILIDKPISPCGNPEKYIPIWYM